jgi:phospholipase/carboxylesterase
MGLVMRQDMSMVHHFEPGDRPATTPLLLLHGTGGDENDLLPLGRLVAPGAALLSPRGKVLENGMPRFFRRLAEGVFDEADVRRRADELADFTIAACRQYGLAAPVAMGFSNGANIAAAVLLLRPEAFSGAILLRAMEPLGDPPRPDLSQMPVLMVSGQFDPIITPDNAARLAATLTAAGAEVRHQRLAVGHQLTQEDLTLSRDWLQALGPRQSAGLRVTERLDAGKQR